MQQPNEQTKGARVRLDTEIVYYFRNNHFLFLCPSQRDAYCGHGAFVI
jgi:hypothetical protein